MKYTFEETPGNLPDHAALCYTRTRSGFRPAIPVDNRYKLAGGGYLSTSEDLAKLGRACLDNSLVPSEVIRAFLTAQEVDGQSTYYGLGWQVSRDAAGRDFVGHVGNGVGGYSNFFVYPKEEVVVSLLINCTDPKVQQIIDQGLDHMFSGFYD
jgi:CubicO group peptidase (beta-lactamase class C family)